MPRLSEFYGIVIYMYWHDHQPPHFHAIYGGAEALVRIRDGTVIRGELPRTALKLVRRWRALHKQELLDNWQRAQGAQCLVPIEALG